MGLSEKQDNLVEELQLIPDAYERLGYLVEYGKNLPALDASLKLDNFKIFSVLFSNVKCIDYTVLVFLCGHKAGLLFIEYVHVRGVQP